MAITLAQSLGQNIGIFSDKKRILNGTQLNLNESFISYFLQQTFIRKPPFFFFFFQASASVKIVGRAVSWMMLGKLLLQNISSSGHNLKATTETDNSWKSW